MPQFVMIIKLTKTGVKYKTVRNKQRKVILKSHKIKDKNTTNPD